VHCSLVDVCCVRHVECQALAYSGTPKTMCHSSTLPSLVDQMTLTKLLLRVRLRRAVLVGAVELLGRCGPVFCTWYVLTCAL
jgi:hypothetical protein